MHNECMCTVTTQFHCTSYIIWYRDLAQQTADIGSISSIISIIIIISSSSSSRQGPAWDLRVLSVVVVAHRDDHGVQAQHEARHDAHRLPVALLLSHFAVDLRTTNYTYIKQTNAYIKQTNAYTHTIIRQ